MFSQWDLELTESVFASLVLELNLCTTVPDAFFFLFPRGGVGWEETGFSRNLD